MKGLESDLALAALRDERDDLSRMLQAVPCGIKVVTLDPVRITFWNRGAEEMYGFSTGEALGRHPSELLGTRLPRPFDELLEEVLATGTLRVEAIETRKDGVEIVSDLRLCLQHDEDGRPAAIISTSTDITREKAALDALARSRDQAEAANAAKSEFLAMMSHELRTPLGAIIGYGELLQEDAQEAGLSRYVEDLDKILAAGQHLLGLIDNILDLSQLVAGRVAVRMEQVEVAELVGAVARLVRPKALAGGNHLQLDVAPDLGAICTDGPRLKEVLEHLADNACKFTRDGTIALSAWRDANGLALQVCDTGIGIHPDAVEALFKPFHQADTSHARSHGGTGLGLALVRQLTSLLNAKVFVTSTPGQGATFTVRLPV